MGEAMTNKTVTLSREALAGLLGSIDRNGALFKPEHLEEARAALADPLPPAGGKLDNSPKGVKLEVFEIVCKERDALQAELTKAQELLSKYFCDPGYCAFAAKDIREYLFSHQSAPAAKDGE
jgi:hypothetical protein